MIWSKQRFAKSWSMLGPVLRRTAFILLPISVTTWLMQWGISSIHQLRFDSPNDLSTSVVIGAGIFAFAVDSIISVAWILIVAQCTALMVQGSQEKPWKLVIKEYHQVFIEYIRSVISVLLWGLLFIVPGFIRWVQLTFTCFVSLLNGPYKKGKRDALATSTKLVKGHWLGLSIFLILAYGLVEFIEKLGIDSMGMPPVGAAFYLLGWVVTVYTSIYLTLTYLDLDKEAQA